MNNEQQPTAELIDKPATEVYGKKLIVPEEWAKHFQTISKTLTEMDSWKTMTIEKDGITKVTAKRVIAKKLRVKIEDVRKILGRTIMARKAKVDAFAESLSLSVAAVETALEVIEKDHKAKVRAEAEQREAEAAKILNERISQLESYDYIPADVAAVGKMTSPDFLQLLDARRKIFEAAELTRVRMAEILSVGPDDISPDAVGMMTAVEFSTYLDCHRVACEVARRERVEAEQAERERVEKLERELEESQRRIAELEAATIADRRRQLSEVSDSQISDDMLMIMSDDSFRDLLAIAVERKNSEAQQSSRRLVDTENLPPQLGEVIDAEFELIQPGVVALSPGYDVQSVCDTVEIAVNLRIDDSELYRIGNELDLSADAFRVLMHLGDGSLSAVFRIEKKTGLGTLIRVNGLDVDRPF